MGYLPLVLLVGLASVLLPSCDKDKGLADLNLQIRFTPGGADFASDQVYQINGTAVKFNVLRFYMSEMGLVDASGDQLKVETYILAQPGQQDYDAGQVLPQTYSAFGFSLGIDSLTNHADPTQYGSSNPLAPQSPSMHWSWASGYIFVRIDGIYDGDGDGIPDPGNGFEVHLGTDAFLADMEFSGSFGSDDAEQINIGIAFDPLVLFDGVDFPAVNTTHTMDNMPMAMQVRNNIPQAFSMQP